MYPEGRVWRSTTGADSLPVVREGSGLGSARVRVVPTRVTRAILNSCIVMGPSDKEVEANFVLQMSEVAQVRVI